MKGSGDPGIPTGKLVVVCKDGERSTATMQEESNT